MLLANRFIYIVKDYIERKRKSGEKEPYQITDSTKTFQISSHKFNKGEYYVVKLYTPNLSMAGNLLFVR